MSEHVINIYNKATRVDARRAPLHEKNAYVQKQEGGALVKTMHSSISCLGRGIMEKKKKKKASSLVK